MIIKIIEVIGTSEKSFEDALQNIVTEQGKEGNQVTGIHVVNQTAEVKDGKIAEFKVNAKVALKQ